MICGGILRLKIKQLTALTELGKRKMFKCSNLLQKVPLKKKSLIQRWYEENDKKPEKPNDGIVISNDTIVVFDKDALDSNGRKKKEEKIYRVRCIFKKYNNKGQ